MRIDTEQTNEHRATETLCRPSPLHSNPVRPNHSDSADGPPSDLSLPLHQTDNSGVHYPGLLGRLWVWIYSGLVRGQRYLLHISVCPMFAWYDLWVGVFIDTRKRRLYIFPIPCVGLMVQLPIGDDYVRE